MKVFTIALLTLREATRKRIILAGVLLSLLFLVIFATGAHFITANLHSIAKDGGTPGGINSADAFIEFQSSLFFFMGLFMAYIIATLVAVFAAAATISNEVEQGTLQSIIARPISRTQIIFGKWLGLCAMVGIYAGALFLALVLIINNQSGWMPQNVPLAALVFIGESLVVLTAALFGSAFLSSTVNAIVVLMLYMTALIGGMMEWIGVMVGKQALSTTGIASSLIMPTDALYRYTVHLLRPDPGKLGASLPPGADLGPFGAASPPSIWILLYTALFTIALLIGAIKIFSHRDL